MDYEAHFVRDSGIFGGEAAFRGTRVLLRVVLADPQRLVVVVAVGVKVRNRLRVAGREYEP